MGICFYILLLALLVGGYMNEAKSDAALGNEAFKAPPCPLMLEDASKEWLDGVKEPLRCKEVAISSHAPRLLAINFKTPEKAMHSASITRVGKSLLLVYYAGSREGRIDVKIYAKRFSLDASPTTNYIDVAKKTPPYILLTRERLMEDSKTYIKKLGNPVIYNDGYRINLFVSATSLGGWGTTKLYHYTAPLSSAKNTRLSIRYKGEIKLSPFVNISTLVRAAPVGLYKTSLDRGPGEEDREEDKDGNKDARLVKSGFILPAYHEVGTTYGLLLRFSKEAKLARVTYLNDYRLEGLGLLQPSLLPVSKKRLLIAYRTGTSHHHHFKMRMQLYNLAGDKALPIETTTLDNLEVSVAMINAFGYHLLLKNAPLHGRVYNSRGALILSAMGMSDGLNDISDDVRFSNIVELDRVSKDIKGEVSYPSMTSYKDALYIVYTDDRKDIGFISLNAAFIQQALKDKEGKANKEGEKRQAASRDISSKKSDNIDAKGYKDE